MIREAATAGLVQCGNCDVGFRRVNGIHIASQRLGMIPDIPCDRVFAAQIEGTKRPWRAYVDGAPLRDKYGMPRHYATAKSAYAAACKAAPRRWHE
jgi:hypothetical protein